MARAKRVAVYARLSLTTEESVSIERQLAAGRDLAKARGWQVMLEAADDGVSATKRRPEQRAGWQQVLEAADGLDAVIVWKVDRLARRVLDFLHANEALQAKGAGLVAVEDPIDMTTAQGRAFATMLAVFGEMEAAAISARTTAARRLLVSKGRAVGNRPWPYESVPNEDGPGLVWRPIPERADAVREAAAAIASGHASLASVARDWTARGFSPPHGGDSWNPSSVRVLLTSPVLTGASYFDGDGRLLRDKARGTIRRDKARQILTPAEHRAIVKAIEARKYRDGARPIRLPLLHKIAVCGTCGGRLQISRPTKPGKVDTYRCDNRECKRRVSIMAAHLEPYVVDTFLSECAERPVEAWQGDPAASARAADIAEAAEALAEVNEQILLEDDDDRLLDLAAHRRELRAAIEAAEAAAERERVAVPGVTLGDLWAATDDDETVDGRRDVLASAFARVEVAPTTTRRGFRPERVTIVPATPAG